MSSVVPFDLKNRLEVSLQPADLSVAQAAVTALAKGTQIPPGIEDLPAYKKTMAEFLARYPADVLLAAVNEAIPKHKWMPGTNEMIELCERLVEPRYEELRRVERVENQKHREAAERAERQRHAASWRSWRVDLQARLAIAGNAPSLDDVELATGLQKILLRAGMALTWGEFAAADCRGAADLCKRLAEIARGGKPPDQGAIVGALTDAGLEAPPAQPPRPSAERKMRPLGAVLRAVIRDTNGWHMPDEEDPKVQRWLREMEDH